METFDSIITNFETDIPLFDFTFKFLLTCVLSWTISIIYKYYKMFYPINKLLIIL